MSLLLFLACAGGAESAAGCDTGYDVSWDGWAHGFFLSYCASCHSEAALDRHGAPEGVNFDTEAQARALAEAIRLTVIEERSMPLGGGMRDDDRVLLERWLNCATEAR